MDRIVNHIIKEFLADRCYSINEILEKHGDLQKIAIPEMEKLKNQIENHNQIPNSLQIRIVYGMGYKKTNESIAQISDKETDEIMRLAKRVEDIRDDFVKNFDDDFYQVNQFMTGQISYGKWLDHMKSFESNKDLIKFN